MKKNILYIFICIITMVLFFGVAATCNLCGIPVEIGETEDASNEDGTEDADEQDDDAVQDSGDDAQGDDNGGQDGSQGNNNDDSQGDDNDGQDGSQGDDGDDPQEDEEANNDPVGIANLVYDFMEGASGAYWRTGAGDISFGGELNDSRGFATFRDNIILEDGVTYSKVLETHPEWVDNGFIVGTFPNNSDKIQIPAGARFTAKIGFIDGLTLTDGVTFRISFYDSSGHYHFPSLEGIHCANDESLDTLDIDLSSIAGKSGPVVLAVDAGATSAQDWAVWVDPKIIK